MSNLQDYNIGDQTGAAFRAELNLTLGDIQSLNSGSSDPSTTTAYKIWADTANNLLKIRNGSNNGWLTLGDLTDAVNLGLATKASPSFTGTVTSAGDIVMSGNGSLQLPVGTTAQRPTATTGDIRFNTSLVAFEGYNGSAWGELAAGVPIGTVLSFAATSPPSGFLECNGANVSRSTYASLFSTVGTSFGIGDGSSTFGLPDLRGQFVRGWVSNGSVDSGRTFGSTQTDQNKSHAHSVTDPGHVHATTFDNKKYFPGGGSTTIGYGGAGTYPADVFSMSNANTGISLSNDGGTENRPKNVALMYVIKF